MLKTTALCMRRSKMAPATILAAGRRTVFLLRLPGESRLGRCQERARAPYW